jgi:hypothetical protein
MSISGGVISTTFTCDPDSNELTGNGRATTWTPYNKPASITRGSSTIGFLDGPEHQRFQQVTPQGTILYMDGFVADAGHVFIGRNSPPEGGAYGKLICGV